MICIGYGTFWIDTAVFILFMPDSDDSLDNG